MAAVGPRDSSSGGVHAYSLQDPKFNPWHYIPSPTLQDVVLVISPKPCTAGCGAHITNQWQLRF